MKIKSRINRVVSVILTNLLFLCIIPIYRNNEVKAAEGLRISYSPYPLTAGCVSELIDPANPFTLFVTDENGEAVDLTLDNKIDHRTAWNSLFKDHHPETLGQYYWTRTDLHNDDASRLSNKALYGFEPISIDFSQASQGKYIFKNFVANDAGFFYITVYTPDRRKAGTVKIEVVQPTLNYEIINTEDPDQRIFTVPGNPDFILTAADNRLYQITAYAFNAQGIPLRGTDKDVNVCSGLREYARFTPFTTRPANFDFARTPSKHKALYRANSSYPDFLTDQGSRYYLYLGIDYNSNGKIDVLNKEAHPMGAFNVFDVDEQKRIVKTDYYTYYVTSNVQWENGNYATIPQFDVPPPDEGWGLGSIYGSSHQAAYLFADINGDGKFNYRDSLIFDSMGRCKFYIFSEDITSIGGLVACNPYGDRDVAGGPPLSSEGPQTAERRFRPDYTFYLDFDAISPTLIGSGKPSIKVYHAGTGEELGKVFHNPSNYDLIYSIENHLRIVLEPADPRDMPLSKEGIISLQGAQHQNSIYGRLHAEQTDNTIVTSATMHFTPTGSGEHIAWMDCIFENKQEWSPRQFKLEKILYFDALVGGGLKVTPSTIYENEDNEVFILVSEIGTDKPVSNATVKAFGCGVDFVGKTNKDGRITTIMHPSSSGEIIIEVSAEKMLPGKTSIRVVEKEKVLFLELDPYKTPLNIRDIVVSGRTLPEAILTANGKTIPVNTTGAFSFEHQLEEGLNSIQIIASHKGVDIKKTAEIFLDTQGPSIMLDSFDKIIDQIELSVKGRVEPDSRVRVNDLPAIVVHDIFKVDIPIKKGVNTLYIEAWDALGNKSSLSVEVYNYQQIVIELVIGKAQAFVNKIPIELDIAPLIISGRTLVPIRFIAEAFGAKVEWTNETQSITIEMDQITIVLQIGNKTAFINGKAHALDAAPMIVNSRTVVPVRFIAEALGAVVEWVKESETIVIRRLI